MGRLSSWNYGFEEELGYPCKPYSMDTVWITLWIENLLLCYNVYFFVLLCTCYFRIVLPIPGWNVKVSNISPQKETMIMAGSLCPALI